MNNFLAKIRPLPRKWLLLGLGILILLLWFLFGGKNENEKEYETIRVQRGDLVVSITSTGTVEPENRLEIKPPVAGRIEEIHVQEGQTVSEGQRLASMSSTERAAMLDSARARGDAELRRWKDFYRATPIYAPISGTIINRAVEPGQTVTNADPILVMADRLAIKAQVDETDLARIRVGQAAQVTLDAYPDKPLRSEVTHIAYEATVVNNVTNYYIDVIPQEPAPFLRSGMTANVEFFIQRQEKVLTLPAQAVKQEGKQATVTLADSEKLQKVSIGISDGSQVEIKSGLKEGDAVLVEKFTASSKSQVSSPLAPPRGGRGGRGGRRP